jgi:hypothetical protein
MIMTTKSIYLDVVDLAPTQKKTVLVSRCSILAAMLISSSFVPLVAATPITVTQKFTYGYSYLPKCTAFDIFGACISNTDPIVVDSVTQTNSLLQAHTRLDPTTEVKGTDETYAEFDIDVNNGGVVKSKSSVRANSNYSDDGVNFDYVTAFNASASTLIQFEDLVSTDNPNGKIFRFQAEVTGQFRTLRNFSDGYGGLYPQNGDPAARFDHSLSLSGLLTNDSLTSDSASFNNIPGLQPIDIQEDTKNVDLTLTFLDILYPSTTPQLFYFDFSDIMSFEMNNPDTGAWSMFMENDLSNTIRIYASVFDENGNLLPDARVNSSFGFTYDTLPVNTSSVPAPSGLLALGGLVLWLRRKFA